VAAETVMIVDDDPEIRHWLVKTLTHLDYRVIPATHGGEALRLLRAADHPPCLILLDFNMPVMDAWEFRAEQLRAPELAAIPVVIISAHPDLAETGRQMRVAAVLEKPVRREALLAVLKRFCKSQRG
jgi:two-component system, chemotaxis family, chemotaxis protein CheY